MIRLVQLAHARHGRKVGIVQQDNVRLIQDISIYRLAERAFSEGVSLEKAAQNAPGTEVLDYRAVHQGQSPWTLLPAFDHPDEPGRCLVTGTGLTHKGSAEKRQAMHAAQKSGNLTDSMRMYQLGLQGGRPAPGEIGVSPEWFYKGCGTILRAHGQPLEVPTFALDGGEEAEVAGAYWIDPSGAPRRVGFMLANEFSDHQLEEQNYLYLAPSKLRTCAVGPELVVGGEFEEARGTVRIHRNGSVVWSSSFATGQRNMSHTLANLEHHHFKYEAHRRPGDAHIHFFGADTFSFGGGIRLLDGDVMEIELEGFGRSLANPIKIDRSASKPVRVQPL